MNPEIIFEAAGKKLSGAMIKIIFLAAILFSLDGFTAHAGIQNADTKESLRGLNGVYVVSQVVDEHLEDLTTNDIDKLVSAQLSAAGISMDSTPKKFNGDANLSVTVDVIKQPQLDVYVFTVEVAVTQDVRLSRDAHAKWISAETWRRTLQGITSSDRTDVIQDALKKCVAMFIADYRAVNPNAAN
jgi:hypothetical protein